MKRTFGPLLIACCLFSLISMCQTSTVAAQEPNWYPYVIARGEDRQLLQTMPMHQRPFRPLHLYGNAIRRSAHYGTPMPMNRVLQAPLAVPRVLGDRLAQQSFRRF